MHFDIQKYLKYILEQSYNLTSIHFHEAGTILVAILNHLPAL